MARHLELGLEEAALRVLPLLTGAFSFVLLDERTLYAARDPHGIRPLSIGRLDAGWCVASETAALDVVGATYVRDVEPGELVAIDDRGLRSRRFTDRPEPKLCLFEFVYLGRADSRMYGRSLHEARRESGRRLARRSPVEGDLVIPIPDTATSAAQGYAEASGIPFGEGLMKNRYIGRTFIQPTPALRQRGVKLKLNPLPDAVARQAPGGRRRLDRAGHDHPPDRPRSLRDAGAAAIHLRIVSPPIRWPCFYGIDMSTREELDRRRPEVDEVRRFVGADTLAYLPLEDLVQATGAPAGAFCRACFDGRYPVPVGDGRPPQVRPRGTVTEPPVGARAYRTSGVDLDAAARTLELIQQVAAGASRPEVLDGVGGFAGLYDLGDGRLLAAGTDGVGTKLEVARLAGRLDTVGIDLVAMCANDVVCTGAEPLFFLDYLAVGRLVPEEVAEIVAGVAEGCRRARCALLGGETAEHPGVLEAGRFDLAGFCVGLVRREELLGRQRVSAGDVLIGLPSTGCTRTASAWSVARCSRTAGPSTRSSQAADPWPTSCSSRRVSTWGTCWRSPGAGPSTPRPTSRGAGSTRTCRGSCPRGWARSSTTVLGRSRQCSRWWPTRPACRPTSCSAC